MSETLRPVEQLTDAEAYAELAVEIMASELTYDLPLTGFRGQDNSNAELRQHDRAMQAEVARYDMIYFGHTNSYQPHFYHALLAGYNPDSDQIQACLSRGGHNFIRDEIFELHVNHNDIDEDLQRYGYQHESGSISDEYPVAMPFVGAYAVPRTELRDMLAELYERGLSYRAESMGFPWVSDKMPVTEEMK